jgi:uncharacterized protein YegP (UPF0339 family)
MILNIRALAALAALSLSAAACAAPVEEEAIEVEETNQDLVSRSAYFETFEGLDGKFYFNVMAGNGENVLRSQGYTELRSAEAGIESVLAHGIDKRNFDVQLAQNGEWYFNLKAANGEVIGTSELYVSKWNAQRGAVTVRKLVRLARATSQTTPAPRKVRFEVFTGEDSQTYFRLRAGNGEILLGSEGYSSRSAAEDGIAAVVANGGDAVAYDVFPAYDASWGVRLVARNGETIARGETYVSKSNATRAVNRMAEILRGRVTVTAN